MRCALVLALAGFSAFVVQAQPFIPPTPNRALLTDGGLSEKYLVGTTGKPWPSGGYGCVRSEGFKMHEGLDIRSVQRNKQNEPTDPIYASAAGTVAYINGKPALSNYGRYIVLRHNIEGLQICTLYAHLGEIADGLAIGQPVKQGQIIGTMGRSTNTREGISKERAHLHFEIDFVLSDRYPAWHAKYMVGSRNDHGAWNGQNLGALDPAPILLGAAREGANFSLVKHLQSRKEVCRVFVRDTNFSFLQNYAPLIQANAQKQNAAGYEIALDFNGAPIELIPRAAGEIKGAAKVQLLKVNEAELQKHRCNRLVLKRGGRYQLSNAGELRAILLSY